MDIPVRHDEIYVERRPVDENKTDAAPVNDSEEIRVPIVEEKLEVTKNRLSLMKWLSANALLKKMNIFLKL